MTSKDTEIEAVGHTAGPWHYDEEHGWIYHQQAVLTTYIIANMESGNEANARLIAAAPDLLEAIKAFLPSKVFSGNRNIPDDITIPLDVTIGELRKLEAAIAKAEGRAP